MQDHGDIRRLTKRPARCSYCGAIIPPGRGRVWHCLTPGRCAASAYCVRGWHASCLDEHACKARVVVRHRARLAARAALKAWRANHNQPEQLELLIEGV